jgi:predicted enzyme related to lactoylglutathione lyase
MTDAIATNINRPVWIDLASSDPAASRDFYAGLFGWSVEVNPDPQYGGYALGRLGGKDVAGIGPKMMPQAPTAWTVYIGTNDLVAFAARAVAAGATIVAPPMQIGDQGSMAVVQDPSGAVLGVWQAAAMSGFGTDAPGSFRWAELNARGIDKALPFYRAVLGWEAASLPMGDAAPYIEFRVGEERVAGGMEMNPMVPAEIPSYWMVYFSVDDVDVSFAKALNDGAHELLAPMDFPGGRFAILSDPQGAVFGLHRITRG